MPPFYRNKWTVVAAVLMGTAGGAQAQAVGCFPVCDYNHYYGPHDFTYLEFGLYGFPRCDARGNCSPDLVESRSDAYGIGQGQGYLNRGRGRITIRVPSRLRPLRPQR